MNSEEDQPEAGEDVGYEPPAIVVLGSVDQLTAQGGSVE